MRVVMGRSDTRALKLLHADLNLRQAAVVLEFRVVVVAPALDRRRDLPVNPVRQLFRNLKLLREMAFDVPDSRIDVDLIVARGDRNCR